MPYVDKGEHSNYEFYQRIGEGMTEWNDMTRGDKMVKAAVEAFNAEVMCKGCLTMMVAPRDLKYECPRCTEVKE